MQIDKPRRYIFPLLFTKYSYYNNIIQVRIMPRNYNETKIKQNLIRICAMVSESNPDKVIFYAF